MSHPPTESRCQHKDAANRQCRMPRMSKFITLCPTHARQALRSPDASRDHSQELLGPISDFRTAAAINHALGRIYVLLAANRISSSQAAVLTYVCQLMLQTLKRVNCELIDATDSKWRDAELFRVIRSLPALSPELGASKA